MSKNYLSIVSVLKYDAKIKVNNTYKKLNVNPFINI